MTLILNRSATLSALDAIKVTVIGPQGSDASAANALPILHEIKHALDKLAASGEPTTIDLSAIPFGPGDKEQLFETLGSGEVDASVEALGNTRVRETRYPGVWLIEHQAPQGEELATHIEITRLPAMLVTPEEDVEDAARALAETLTGMV